MNILQLIVINGYAHKNTVVNFKAGVNWLTGENEGGKTELLDMIQYALTGQGLRSDKSEYKGLDVSLYFKVLDKIYFIQRAKQTKLQEVEIKGDSFVKKSDIAVGITAVNSAIIERLGYDASVYESLNYSKQLGSTALTDAKKTERINLINKINGVHEATAFEKYLDNQKKDLRSQLKVYQGNNLIELVDFTVDSELEPYCNEANLQELTEKINATYKGVKQYEDLRYQVSYIPRNLSVSQSLPEEVKDWSLEAVKEYIEQYKDYLYKDKENKKNNDKLAEQLAKTSVPLNLKTEEELKEYENIIQNNKSYDLQQKLIKEHEVTCPSCSVTFTPEHITPDNLYEYQELNISEEDYKVCKDYYKNELPKITRLNADLEALKSSVEALQEKKVQSYPIYGTVSLEALELAYKDIYAYTLQTANKEKALKELFEKNPSFKTLEEIETILLYLPTMQTTLSRDTDLKEKVISYNARKQVYEASVKAQENISKQVNVLEDKLFVIEALLEESKRLKLEIQNNCIPVLNTIASKMINKLTGGKRYGLTLNDTFELQLDGKPIQAYSGSTIVLANVAFRIALIEMFFKKTFPVFIGDEIDAFADPIRAQHIHDSLLRLEKEGYQLILVSHNRLDFQGNKINLADIKKV